MLWAAVLLQVGWEATTETAEGPAAGAKPVRRSHPSHWTESWNPESRPHLCWTRIPPELGGGSPHRTGRGALQRAPTDTPRADGGGSGAARRTRASAEISAHAFRGCPYGWRRRGLAAMPARGAARLRLG